ncbi:oligosaccharide flippase family protein [Carnobacterium maltaromaticum]|uniref:oligosaccharide flippase family protein n=1 Tax=Carnobacterium maltaromaticum TaxID=2751 RepID=UPI001072E4A1|nr:oligosaccharide flippase family protein [Carnobacterium maltaromaticum]TFJ71978.1 polysaccharide biosynthesis protein [Carnobacterium maltaromaticum]TFJ76891.1 polysaccharide biosynthesis protein [Carnobacterium maltaromaticum]
MNQNTGLKTVIYNVMYLFFGNVFTKLLAAVATILYARFSGASEYGILSVALAFAAIVSYFTDAGISQTTIREGTKPDADISSIMFAYTKIRLFLFFGVTLFSIVFINIFYSDPVTRSTILFLTVPTLLGALAQGIGITYFQIIEKMKYVSLINIIVSVGNSLALFIGVVSQLSIQMVSLLYGIASILGGIYAIWVVYKQIDFKVVKKKHPELLNQLLSFTINGIIVMMIPQLGPIILEKVLTTTEVGNFSAAFKIPSVLYQFPGIVATAFYPKLFSLGNSGELSEHRKICGFELKIMGTLGAALALPFILAPGFWIRLLLTDEFAPAIPALVVLSYLILLQAIKYPLADYLTTVGNQWKRTIVMFVGLIVVIILYIVLGTNFGILGGALAPLISELVIIFGCVLFIPKGFSFLFKNSYIMIIAFVVSFISYRLIFSSLHPLIGLTIVELIFITIIIFSDRTIRNKVISMLKNKSFKIG